MPPDSISSKEAPNYVQHIEWNVFVILNFPVRLELYCYNSAYNVLEHWKIQDSFLFSV